MAVGDVVGVEATGEDFDVVQIFRCVVKRNNGGINDRFADGVVNPTDAISKGKPCCGAAFDTEIINKNFLGLALLQLFNDFRQENRR